MRRIVAIPYRPQLHHKVVNWWPGKLRPYESPLSFTVNFCVLNGISARQYDSRFQFDTLQEKSVDGICHRIAQTTGEHLHLVKSMYDRAPHLFELGNYGVAKYFREFRVCPRCIQFGYHSHLHDLEWLQQCPFHLLPLERPNRLLGKSEAAILTKVFQENCNDWPRSDVTDSQIRGNGYVYLILTWSAFMSSEIKKLQQPELLAHRAHENFSDEHLDFVLGRLCAIEPMPSILDPLVIKRKKWTLRKKILSKESGRELAKVFRETAFDYVYEFYKVVMAHSDHPPPYMTKFELMKGRLRKNHHGKNCAWFYESAGWSSHWMKRIYYRGHPGGGTCIYNWLLNKLEIEWGVTETVASYRESDKLRHWFLWASRELHKYQFVTYKPERELSNEGLLYLDMGILSSCEWKNQPLSDCLNVLASFELDIAFNCGLSWLRSVQKYDAPWKEPQSFGSVRFTVIDSHMTVLKWQSF